MVLNSDLLDLEMGKVLSISLILRINKILQGSIQCVPAASPIAPNILVVLPDLNPFTLKRCLRSQYLHGQIMIRKPKICITLRQYEASSVLSHQHLIQIHLAVSCNYRSTE